MAKPTNNLRWLKIQRVVTAAEVKAYRAKHGRTLAETREILQNATIPRLQVWWKAEGFEHADIQSAGGYWEDVPVIVQEET